jgi:hypothetical protein
LLLRRAAGGLLLLDLRARHAVRRQQRDELLLGEGEAQRAEGNPELVVVEVLVAVEVEEGELSSG